MKYKGVLAGLFMAAAVAFAAPVSQAANDPAPADPPAAEIEAPTPVTVEDLIKKSPKEQMLFVISVIDNIMEGLKSPYHNGEPKPKDVRQEHLRMALFINDLFLPRDKDDNVTVNDDAIRVLFVYFDAYNEQQSDAPAALVVSHFLNDEYQEHLSRLAATPRQPGGPGY